MGYSNLKAEMIRRNIHTKEIAKLLNINEKTARDKINRRISDFKVQEIQKIKKEFFADLTLDYLFDNEVVVQEKKKRKNYKEVI